MRIAYICLDPGIPVFGAKGASVHVQSMVRAFQSMGADVTLFSPRCEGTRPKGLETTPVVPFSLPSKSNAEARMQALMALDLALPDILRDAGPFDLVYERHALLSHSAMTWAREAGVPSVLEVNAPLMEEQQRHREMILPQDCLTATQAAMQSAALVAAVSPQVVRYAQDHGAENVLHLPNAIDPAMYDRPRQGNRPFTVGFVGSLKPWHDLDVLVSAMEILHASLPDIRLLIVGDGPERARFSERIAALGGEISGLIPHDAVPDWLARTDVGIAPYSAAQDFYFSPLKLYEYMGARLPVIASDVGDLARIVTHGDTGLICPPDDPAALARAIATLAQDPERARRMGEAGHRHVIAHHTWQANARTVLERSRLPMLSEGL